MFEGESRSGLEFYAELRGNDEFCATFGRAMLAAGHLEGAILRHLNNRTDGKEVKPTNLGRLIGIAKQRGISDRMVECLEDLNGKRILFAHNIHNIFGGEVSSHLVPTEDLIDADVLAYVSYAEQLWENLEGIAELFEQGKV